MKIKRIFKFLLLFISIISISLLTGCKWNSNYRDPSTFNDFSNDIFKLILNKDEMDLNFLFNDPTAYGLEHGEATLPTPSKSSLIGNLLINLYFRPLSGYVFEELDTDQKATYLVLAELIDYINKTTSMSYLKNDYLGSYLGYQAQLPILLSQYHFRSKADIDNYLSYLNQMPEAFVSYVDFEVEKADAGYGMPNYVIDKVIDQCQQFVDEVRNAESVHFMIDTFETRINRVDFLSADEAMDYVNSNTELVNTKVIEAYEYVANNLNQIRDKSVNDYGLCYYVDDKGNEIGKNYYEALFKHTVGYDISCSDAITYYDNKIDNIISSLRSLAQTDPTNYDLAFSYILMEAEPSQILNYFIDNYSRFFPQLDIEMPTIEIRYVDKSMEDHYSPASYSVSPIDQTDLEFIYLNNKSIKKNGVYDYNYLYTTLAHEGFPGHMYQNIYFKNQDTNIIRKVIKNGGYVEGWATYIEYFSYEFLRGEVNDTILETLRYNELLSGTVQARCDLGIHYEGWKEAEVEAYLGRYFKAYDPTSEKYQEGAATRLIQQLVEVPTNSQKYFFTGLKLIDMYENAKNTNNFDCINFHKIILDNGPVSLEYTEQIIKNTYLY